MIFKGTLLNLGTIDICGRKFSKDCKISFPEKVPITIDFNDDDNNVVGYGEISMDDKGLKVIANIFRNDFDDQEYNVGGYYTNVKSQNESGIKVIDKCELVSMSIVSEPSDKNLKIRRI